MGKGEEEYAKGSEQAICWASKAIDGARSNYFEDRGSGAGEVKDSQKTGRLDAQAILLLVVHALFGGANALSGTFVGVYLWKAKNDFTLIGWFTLTTHLTMAMTFWLAGKWVKEQQKNELLAAWCVQSPRAFTCWCSGWEQAASTILFG